MKNFLFLLALLIYVSSANTGEAIFDDCISCHDLDRGTDPVYPAINISSFGIHRDINSTDGAGNISNDDCIICHYNVSNMFSSGFTVDTYKCEDCHVNGTIQSAPKVYNHIKNANISVNAMCGDCHNKTANIFSYNASASAAHYGRKAGFGIPEGEEYCIFCHKNSSSDYKDIMRNQNNTRIEDHTSGIINSGHLAQKPGCTICHGQDMLHGSNISKPILDSDFCINCHKDDPLKKNKHNNKVECISCHMDKPSDIHTIKYVMQDGSYRGINATVCNDCHNFNLPPPYFQLPFPAADCIACHQDNGLQKFPLAPKIPSKLNHSANNYSGALWNGSQPEFWSSQPGACNYCHGNSIHGSNALGKIENISSGNSIGQNITNTSYWCASCHFNITSSSNYSYNGKAFSPVPPEITNSTGLVPQKAQDGTDFFNHSLKEWSDNICRKCHSTNSPNSTTRFVHDVSSGGGGSDCVSCHDINSSGAPSNKRIIITAFEKGVHRNLNSGKNKACWACHGDGSEPDGHPAEYKEPKKCSSDNCHSLSQNYRAPMVYSHFKNASRNNNPGNVLNFNVTTLNNCEECHANSATSQGKNIDSTASHYASLELPESINCIYCHLNEDNAKIWGNATLINKNMTSLVELDRANNKFNVKAGESVNLGSRFRLKLLEVSKDRTALIELFKDEVLMDKTAADKGNYTYEETITIDNSSLKVPVIVLNFTGIFYSGNSSFVQFEGFRIKRVHSETKTTSCYLCHVSSRQQIKYRVIERVNNSIDDIYYTEELVNFTDKKDYNETDALRKLSNITDTDPNIDLESGDSKVLFEGEVWNISNDYSLLVKETTRENDEAYISIRAGNYLFEDIVKKGDYFEYKPVINYLGYQSKNITIFKAKVSEIIQAKPKTMIVLKEVMALSPDIDKIEEKQVLEGYNTSWLWENSTIIVGKIPSDFHSPQIFDGKDGGADCISCHGVDGFSQKKVISLGKHEMLNGGKNGACYACHGGNEKISSHPDGFGSPRECKSCHAGVIDNYSAVYIGDEEHKNELCADCHITDSHNLKVYDVIPSVKKISITKQDNKLILKGFASAGYKMMVRGARYYIDSQKEIFSMSPVDGLFDSQVEEIFAHINVSKISPGKHSIYVEAMERDGKWGTPTSLEINVDEENIKKVEENDLGLGILAGGLTLILFFNRKDYKKIRPERKQ